MLTYLRKSWLEFELFFCLLSVKVTQSKNFLIVGGEGAVE